MTEVSELAIIPRDMSQTSIDRRHSVVLKALEQADTAAKQLLTKYGPKSTRLATDDREPFIYLRRTRSILVPLRWAWRTDSSPAVADLQQAATDFAQDQRQELFAVEKERSHLNYVLSALAAEHRRLQEFERCKNELSRAGIDDSRTKSSEIH